MEWISDNFPSFDGAYQVIGLNFNWLAGGYTLVGIDYESKDFRMGADNQDISKFHFVEHCTPGLQTFNINFNLALDA